jgi:hypothetical protein
MRNRTNDLGCSTTDMGLHCVWLRVHDDGGDRLISIWIDPTQTAFQAQIEGLNTAATLWGAAASGTFSEPGAASQALVSTNPQVDKWRESCIG